MSPEQAQEQVGAENCPAADVSPQAQFGGAAGVERLSENLPILAFKFGGSSLAGAEPLLHSAALVRDARQHARLAVVVSAMRGVTDRLLSIARSVAGGEHALARAEAQFVLYLHREALREMNLEHGDDSQASREIELLGRDLLHEVPLIGRAGAADVEFFDRVASFGERLSARLFAAALTKLGVAAVPVASSDFIITSDEFGNARPDVAQSKRNGREILQPLLDAGIVPVVTGFLGATADGRITTLGRNSSDFSGALIAHCLDASELVIWTDVDGVYTANPNVVRDAQLLLELTYEQAHALVSSGARVLHPDVLPLAAEEELVVWVRNTFKPQLRGTRIGPAAQGGVA
jgi:aspartokinase/homoserine dehydrogenase 1